MTRNIKRLAVLIAASAFLLPVLFAPAAGPKAKSKLEYFTGKVVPLKDVLPKFEARLDPDAVPFWLALVTDKGQIYPLIKSDGARMFFKEPKLQNRPMRLTGRLIPDTHLLQVIQVHSLHKGELFEVFYWCDICVIKRFEKQDCDCCGAPMVLKEEPLKK